MTLDSHDLGIIADDLTGACDAAACFVPRLGPVGVVLSTDNETASFEGVEVINTQSRLRDSESARNCLQRVGLALAAKKVVFKKIDAGLRGPIGAELAGLLAGLKESGSKWECVVAPAIPSIGRTTRGGVQYDHGVPIHQGALSEDPHSPPASADIRQIISQTGGGTYHVGDAETSKDLDRIVDEHLKHDRVVFAGSIGLARALASRIRGHARNVDDGPRAQRPLLVCGSRHPYSARQLEQVKRGPALAFEFNPATMSFDSLAEKDANPPLVVSIKRSEARKPGKGTATLLAAFVEAAASLCERLRIDGLAVIGGETAYQLLQRLGARRLDVRGVEDEVIACSRISGGTMDDCRFISKGGSVGGNDTANRMLSLLTS